MKSLGARAGIAIGVVGSAIALLLFLAAGTVGYWQAWVYFAVYLGGSCTVTHYLLKHDPALLERRMKGGPTAEKRRTQKIIMTGAALGFISFLIIPGLDRRFGWSSVPDPLALAGDLLVALGTYMTYLAYRANTFTSATIEIAANQVVISTGPYAVVRHPMYSSGLVYMIGMPIALASWWGLLGIAIMLPVLVARLRDEEKLLTASLEGYKEYCAKVRWRLIPGIY